MSEHVVELDVVDFVGGFSLESLQNDGILLIRDLHTEVVEDRFETGEGNKSGTVLIFVLEVWFDQETSVFNISAKSLQCSDQNLLLFGIQNVLRVQNRWRIEVVGSLSGILLKCFIREDGV